jgi:hypothetical protein
MTVRSAAATISLIFVASLAVMAGSAGAQSNDAYVGAEVESATQLKPEAPQVAAASVSNGSAVRSATLAFTGGDVLALALVGSVAVMAGGSLLLVRRQKSHA